MVVVGGGLVGLSTACSLLERRPGLDVLVLERGTLPTGASTRNAGFACFGSPSEIAADVDAEGPEKARALVAERCLGLQRLRARFDDAALRYEPCGGYDLLRPDQRHVLERLPALNDLLRPVLGAETFRPAPEALARFGFARSRVAALVENRWEGALHAGFLVRALQARAQRLGAGLVHGVEVEALEEAPGALLLHVRREPGDERLAFRAGQAAVTTNAFARRLLPDLDVVPGRGQVLVTAPMPGLPFHGTFHHDAGDLYFRHLDGRVLLGGGRRSEAAAESTESLDTTPSIQRTLERFLAEVVLPGRAVAIEQRWSGTMAFGKERAPIVERLSPRLSAGVRMSGMGVAIGSRVGDRLAELLLENL